MTLLLRSLVGSQRRTLIPSPRDCQGVWVTVIWPGFVALETATPFHKRHALRVIGNE